MAKRPSGLQGFDEFWQRYLKRVCKKDAQKAWMQLSPSPELVATIMEAIEWQFRQPNWLKDDHQFAPNAATWIRGERWADECPPSLKPKQQVNPLTLAYCGECGNTGWVGEPVRRCACREARTA